ncbi:hypothetical protein PAAG_07573 [Paracoccidioides lutzii Pb01]|uniref:Uncharacterized protein n=1 Tax=Paracoccidioides lutzii (strain ATCC MYA-826 / Pb01) TaxID=502779 RepID=C1HAB9_PARBA|nr:hypothetical protein PAAG_07573 [Paracoccidioides lutzii Pb01]EEH37292.2 hypothetical protein PAAG_07573 [Paracoccidioides lutzii Pb01]
MQYSGALFKLQEEQITSQSPSTPAPQNLFSVPDKPTPSSLVPNFQRHEIPRPDMFAKEMAKYGVKESKHTTESNPSSSPPKPKDLSGLTPSKWAS